MEVFLSRNVRFYWFKFILLTAALSAGVVFHSYSQTCAGLGPVGGGVISSAPGEICANTATVKGEITISANNVDDGGNPNNVKFSVDWNDGTIAQVVSVAGGTVTHTGANAYLSVVQHLFPASGGGVKCEYKPIVTLIVGTLTCGSLGTPPTFVRWNTDDQLANGKLILNETVTSSNPFLVCAGNTTTVTFTDRTTLNCPAANSPTSPNDRLRSRQYIYGTANTMTGTVLVNGTTHTYPFSGAVTSTAATGVTAPPAPTQTLNITVPATATVGQFFEITMNEWDICNTFASGAAPITTTARILIIASPPTLTAPAPQIVCYGTATGTLNFQVSGNTGSTTAIKWYPTKVAAQSFTGNLTNPNGTNNNKFPVTAYKSPALGGTASGVNSSLSSGVGGVYSLWATQTFGLVNPCESQPVEVIFIVKPQLTAPPIPNPLPPPALEICNGGSIAFNQGSAAATQSIATNNFTNSTVQSFNTQYQWSATYSGTYTTGAGFSSATAQASTVTFTMAPEPTPNTIVKIGTAIQYTDGTCTTTPINFASVQVDGKSSIASITGGSSVCSNQKTGPITLGTINGVVTSWEVDTGSGFVVDTSLGTGTSINPTVTTGATVTTYKYRANVQNGKCASVVSSPVVTVTVNPIPPKPTISAGSSTTFCSGGSVTLTSSTSGTVTSWQWYKNGVAVGGATSQTLTLNTVAQSGDYTVTSIGAGCPSLPSDPTTVTVNPLPTATGPTGGGAVCAGNPAGDINWVLSGTAPYSVTWSASGFLTTSSTTTNNFTIVAPAPTAATQYSMTNLVDANGCVGTSLGSNLVVTIGGSPPVLTSGPSLSPAAVCINGASTTDPQVLFTLDNASGGLPGFILNYKIDGVAKPGIFFGTTGPPVQPQIPILLSDPVLNSSVPLPHIVTIVSITSPTSCTTPINQNLSFTVNPLPTTPTGAVSAKACSSATTGSALSVADPDPLNSLNLEIAWSSASTFTAVTGAMGVVSGSNNVTFTPATTATQTFYAFNQNTLTGCISTSGVAVTQTQDLLPTAPNAGPAQPNLCGTTATLAAVAADKGGSGTWTVTTGTATITTPSSPTSTVTGLVQNAPGGAVVNTVLTWTVSSALGACAPQTATVTLTTNPLPTAVNLAPQLCDDAPGAPLQAANIDLTSYNAAATNAPAANVKWFSSPTRTLAFLITAPVTVTNGQIFYYTTTSAVGCPNQGQAAFTINSLPSAVDKTQQFCDNSGGAGVTGINLTTYEMGAGGITAGGTTATRQVLWFEDDGAGGLGPAITTSTNYTITSTKVVHGKIIDKTSTVVPQCSDVADLTLIYKKKPADNPISGPSVVCTSPTGEIYQVDPTINAYTNTGIPSPVHSYTWTVSGVANTVIAGGGTNTGNSFIFLKFPSASGIAHFTVTETVDGCVGNAQTFDATVAGAPPALAFNSPATAVCKGSTVTYSLTSNNPASIYTWSVTGGAIVGSGSGPGLSTITVTWGSLTSPQPTVSVFETSSQGCTGAPASINVNLNDVPAMTSPGTNDVCSGQTPSLTFAATLPSIFAWKVTNITGAISGTTLGATGTGDLSTKFTGATALKNTSGAVGSVSFAVTPTATAAPNCPGTVQTVVLNVNPEPLLVNPQTKTICSGALANYEILLTPLNLPAGTVFNWITPPVMSDGSSQGTSGTNVASGSAGTFHITDQLNNLTALPIKATYTITPTSGLGCTGANQDVVITINPQPSLSNTLGGTVCSQLSIGTTFAVATGSVAAANYNVNSKSIPGGLVAGSGNAVVPATGVSSNYLANDKYTNLSSGPLIVSYVVVPVSAPGCIGTPVTISITINPEPVLASGLDGSVCSHTASGINLNTKGTSVAATGYNIVGITIPTGLTASGTNAHIPQSGVGAGYLANDSYTNTTNGSINVIYSIVPVSASGCAGSPPVPVTLTILPEPVLANLSSSACSHVAIGLTLNTTTTSVAASSYDVTIRTVPAGLMAAGGNAPIPGAGVSASYLTNDIYTNTGSSPLTVIYTVAPRSAGGCAGAATQINMVINPEPVLSLSLSTSVCSHLATGLKLNTNGTSVAAASYNITVRSIAPGLVANSANVAVPATGVANTYLGTDIFTNTTTGPLGVAYTVIPVSSTGCIGVATVVTMTINPEPVLASLDATVCSELPIGLTLANNGSSAAVTNYNITGVLIAGGLTTGGGNAAVPATGVSASYLKNDIYFNSTGSVAKTVKYTIVPVAGTCQGAASVVTMTINPEPVLATTLNTSACSGAASNLTLNTNGVSVGASAYNITIINVPAGLTPGGTNAVVQNNVVASYLANDKFTNTTAAAIAVIYTIVPLSASGCPGPPATVLVTVNPEPVMSGTLDATVCSDVATGLTLNTNGTSVAATKYNIISRNISSGSLVPAGTNATVPATGVTSSYLAADAFTNTTASFLTVSYSVAPVSSLGCVGQPLTITMTINPKPVLSTTLGGTICSGDITNITLVNNGTSVGANTFNITTRTVGTGLVAGGSNAAIPGTGVASTYLKNDTYTNQTAIPANVVYTVVPISASGCQGASRSITMTINPEPVLSTTLDGPVCSDTPINLTLATNGTSVAAANYNILLRTVGPGLVTTAGNAAVPATGVSPTYLLSDKWNNITTGTATVIYSVQPVASGGCKGAAKNVTITIRPEPVLTPTSASQCSDVASGINLTGKATSAAAANFNIQSITIGSGLVANGANAAIPANGVAASYISNDKFTNTGTAAANVTYVVLPVSVLGCIGDPVSILFTVNPEPVLVSTLSKSVCSDVATGLTLSSNAASVPATKYNITSIAVPAGLTAAGTNKPTAVNVAPNYLAGDIFTNITTGSLDVTYTIVPVSATNCLGDPVAVKITVNPEPVLTAGLGTTVCSDVATGLNLTSQSTSVTAANYTITARTIDPALVAAAANAMVPSVGNVSSNYLGGDKFTNTTLVGHPVTYTVVPVSASGCSGSPVVISMTINPEPVIPNTLNATICSDDVVNITLTSTSVAAANYNIISRVPQGGLVAHAGNVTVPATGVAAGYLKPDSFTNQTAANLTVTYVVVPVAGAPTSCQGDPQTITITVKPEPVLSPSLSTTACSGIATGVTLNTIGTSVPAGTYNLVSVTLAGGVTNTTGATNAVPATGKTASYIAGDRFTNVTNSAKTVTYVVTPVSASPASCLGDPVTFTVTINPEPVVATTLNKTVCSNSPTGLTLATTASSVGASTYKIVSITPQSGLVAAGTNATATTTAPAAYLSNDSFTNTTAAALTVTYRVVGTSAAGCSGAFQDIVVTITPQPVLNNAITKVVCSRAASGIALVVASGSVAATTYNIVSVSKPAGLTVVTQPSIPATGVSASYLSTTAYSNLTPGPLDVIYSVVPVNGTCAGAPQDVKVTVNPEPVLASLDNTVCSKSAIGLTLGTAAGSVIAATYNIVSVTVTGASAFAGNATVPAINKAASYLLNDKYTNTGTVAGTVVYQIVPVSSNNCAGAQVPVTIKINPEPVLTPTLSTSVCSANASGIVLSTVASSVAAANYNIASIAIGGGLIPSGSNAVVANGVAASAIQNDSFTNTTNGPLTVTYSIIPVSGTGCIGNPVPVVLTINPEPVMDATLANKTICSRTNTGITLAVTAGSVAAASYNVTLVSQDVGLTGTPTTGTGLPAAAINTDNFVNVTSNPLQVKYQIVPKSAAGCLGQPFIITVTVNPEPVINSSLDATVCSRDAAGITLAGDGVSVLANSYKLISVTFPGTITAGSNTAVNTVGTGTLIKNDTYTNKSAAPVQVVYTITGISQSGCPGQPKTITLTINPEPTLSAAPTPVCSDQPSGISLAPAAGTPPIDHYNLKTIVYATGLTPSGSPNVPIGVYTSASFLAADQYTNTTAGPLQVTYTISAVSNGCTGVDQTVVLTVNPAPAVASNLNKSVCTNDVTGVVFSTDPSSPPAVSYSIASITVAAGLVRTAGNTTVPRNGLLTTDIQNDKFNNPTTGPLTVTYGVQAVTASTCVGPVKLIVVTVEPTITAAPVSTKTDICSNDATNIVLNSPAVPSAGPVTFNYTASSSIGGQLSGFIPAVSNLPAGTTITDILVNNSNNAATVTYTITAVANGAKGGAGCLGTPVSVPVIVEPKPKVVASPIIQTICSGAPSAVVLTTPTVPTAPGVIQFNVVGVAVTGGMTLASPAIPKTVYLAGETIADTWTNPDVLQHSVTYSLQAVVSGGLGCSGDIITVTLNVNPTPQVTASAQAPICSNDFVNISLTSTVDGTINKWTTTVTGGPVKGAGPGSGDLIFQTLNNTDVAPATVSYVITPTANKCVGAPITVNVTVNPIPTISALPTTTTVCYGGTLSQALTSPVSGVTFDWTVDPFPNSEGVAATGNGGLITAVLSNNSGSQDFLTYTIMATGPAPTLCQSQPKIFTVIAAPQVNVSLLNSDPTYVCLENNKDFLQVQLDGQAPFTFTYSINGTAQPALTKVGGFKSIAIAPTVNTTYKILSAADQFGCPYTGVLPQVTYQVGSTDATFAIVGPAASCSPYTTTLKYNLQNGVEYTWRWGDGSPDSIFTYTGADVANFITHHTYVNSSPTGSLKPKIVLQTDLPVNFPGCVKSTTQQVTVYPTIITNVYPDKSDICSGEEIIFTNQSFGVPITGHKWFYRTQGTTDQQDIRTTQSVQYVLNNNTASNPLVIEVVYQATNGNCPAPDVVIPINVYRSATAAFDFGGTLPTVHHYLVGGVANVTFNNDTFSPAIPDPAFQYDWSFGIDSAPSTVTGADPNYNVTYTSEGVKNVTLTVTNIVSPSCTNTLTQNLTIELLPLMAAYTAIPAESCFPTAIVVTGNTSTGDVMLWKLYDQNGSLVTVSSFTTPTFTITSPGTYTLDLRTSDSKTGQFKDADPQTFVVYEQPFAAFQALPKVVFVPNTPVTVINNSAGASAYHWDYGDGSGSSDQIDGTVPNTDPKVSTATVGYSYKIEGQYTITLIASEDHGNGIICRDTATQIVIAKQGGVSKIPNAFSPNPNGPSNGQSASGSNYDVFLPSIKGVEEYNLQIYDRWGNLLFESNSIETGWDGYKDGKLLPAGVYVYKITLRLSDGQRTTQIGDVTMIR